MSAPVDPEVSRRLGLQLTYRGRKRTVEAVLAHGDRLVFNLEGFGDVGGLLLADLFWQAIRSNPGKGKHPLQPRAVRQIKPGKKGRESDAHYAREYGVSSGVINKWRRAGAPLHDPDQMGDFMFTIQLRKETRCRQSKRRKAVLR